MCLGAFTSAFSWGYTGCPESSRFCVLLHSHRGSSFYSIKQVSGGCQAARIQTLAAANPEPPKPLSLNAQSKNLLVLHDHIGHLVAHFPMKRLVRQSEADAAPESSSQAAPDVPRDIFSRGWEEPSGGTVGLCGAGGVVHGFRVEVVEVSMTCS